MVVGLLKVTKTLTEAKMDDGEGYGEGWWQVRLTGNGTHHHLINVQAKGKCKGKPERQMRAWMGETVGGREPKPPPGGRASSFSQCVRTLGCDCLSPIVV